MRRKEREITEFTKMLEIVKSCDCCRLGFVNGDEAYIVPLNFGYETEKEDGAKSLILYFHCAGEGKKLELVRKNGKASFEMDTKHELVTGDTPCQSSYLYQCVMGNGTISLMESMEEKQKGLGKIMEQYTGKSDWTFEPKMLEQVVVLRLEVNDWSCKEH